MKPYEEIPEDDALTRLRAAARNDPFRRTSTDSEEWSERELAAGLGRARWASATVTTPPVERETWSVIGESWRRRHGWRWGS